MRRANKPARYWERLEDGRYAVYDNAWPAWAKSVSTVSDLEYYRRTFDLRRCATTEPQREEQP